MDPAWISRNRDPAGQADPDNEGGQAWPVGIEVLPGFLRHVMGLKESMKGRQRAGVADHRAPFQLLAGIEFEPFDP
jgi:hypothetical protein